MFDAIEAGDTTMVRDHVAGLRERLDRLRQHRLSKEMSDSRAFTNGTLRKIDSEMNAIRAQLEALLADA